MNNVYRLGAVSTAFVMATLSMVPATAQTADTLEDHRPVVSPDGRSLAFMSNRSGVWAVYLMPLDGSRPAQRVSSDPLGEWYPDWSPDGRTLVYHRNDRERGVSYLLTFRIATREETPLGATDARRDYARWSPDGKTLYYMCRGTGVCAISADGREQGVAFGLNANQGDPAVSSDGRWIAYVDPMPDKSEDIFIRPVNGSEPIRVTSDPGRSYGLDWSPDGRFLAYNTTIGDNLDVYIYEMATRRQRRITTHAATDHMPRWLPDGSGLLFTSERSGHERIYRINADGSGLRLIDTRGIDRPR